MNAYQPATVSEEGIFRSLKVPHALDVESYPEPCAHVGISGKTNAEILPKRNKRLPVMRGKEKEHVYENHWE